MCGRLCSGFAFLQVGLVASWARWEAFSTASLPAGLDRDPYSPKPLAWDPPLNISVATPHAAGATTEPGGPAWKCRCCTISLPGPSHGAAGGGGGGGVPEAVPGEQAGRQPCPVRPPPAGPGHLPGPEPLPVNVCDSVSTSCAFQDGLVPCACQPGYLQAQATDRTCTACGSGFWLRNGTCARCSFGFSGAGCQEPFLLALVGVSCLAAGLLWLLLLLCGTASPARLQRDPFPTMAGAPQGRFGMMPPPGSQGAPQPAPLASALPNLESASRAASLDPAGGGEWGPAFLPRHHLDLGPHPADAPHMKTFQGPASSLPSAPQPLGGCSNLVFISDAEEEGSKRSYF